MPKIAVSFKEAVETKQPFDIWKEWERRAKLRKLETKTIYEIYQQWIKEEVSLMVDVEVLR